MGYEVFQRTRIRVEEPAFSIVPDGRLAINAAACRILLEAGVKSVHLLWDRANQKLAAKAAPKNDKNAYAVSIGSAHSGTIRAKAFMSHIGWDARTRATLPATWNEKEKMFEVTVPYRYLGKAADPAKKGRS
jgi:hypothetical protein